MMRINASSNIWLTSRSFRIFVLLLGIGFFVIYGMMLLVVGVNLPDSWVGLIYVSIGLTGAAACFRYFGKQKPIFLIPIFAALILLVTDLVGLLLYGR